MVLTNPTFVTGTYASTGGTLTAASQIAVDTTAITGVLAGAANSQIVAQRMSATGIGAPEQRFTGNFDATAANIDTWFGGLSSVELVGTGSGTGDGNGTFTGTLPGTAAINTVMDQLVAAGLPEVFDLAWSYVGGDNQSTLVNRLTVVPRGSPNPQIEGQTSVVIPRGQRARLRITRSMGTLSNWSFEEFSATGVVAGGSLGAFRFQDPASMPWDASASGPLPSVVELGFAFQVINAPTDNSGRFGEPMRDGDWVVWTGAASSSADWAAEPHQWGVFAEGDILRITQLESEFLSGVVITTPSERNAVIRGANYADSVGEIRMKFYDAGAYDPGDLNTTGDIDEYTDPSDQNGHFAIRLPGTLATLTAILPTLYVYAEDSSGNFTRELNLAGDFTHQGDFTSESDYLTDNPVEYNANDTWRIYVTTTADRFNIPTFDVFEANLSDAVQAKLNAPGHTSTLPAPLTALNNGAEVFEITHSEYRANNPHVLLNNTLAVLKNAPTTFPNTAGTFANEITGSAASVSDPTPVTAIQDVGQVTNNVMTGAGIVNNSFRITPVDDHNWRAVIGGWMYYPTLPTSFTSILRAKERQSSSGSPSFRDIFGMGPNGIIVRRRATTGTTVNEGITHPLTSTEGLVLVELSGGTLTATFRVYTAGTYSIRGVGRLGGAFQGGSSNDYTITDVDVSQAETTFDLNLGAGNQTFRVQYDADSTLYGGSAHILTVSVDSIIGGLDQIDVDVLSASTTVETSIGNTYSDETINVGHVAPGRLMRYVASFRSINGIETGNLECVLALAGYDSNGQPRIFQENTFDLNYPALDVNWNYLLYGGQGVHQNVQMMVLNADTPLIEYPRHATEADWLSHYDRKTDQWVWGNVLGPDQDTEAVHFPETVNFSNLILVSPNQTRYRLTVNDAGALMTEALT